jgi:hypothetical protein
MRSIAFSTTRSGKRPSNISRAAGQHRMRGIDDDDVVAAIDMGRVGREVLAAQPHGDQRSEATDDQTLGVDHDPLLRHLGRLCRKRFHWWHP